MALSQSTIQGHLNAITANSPNAVSNYYNYLAQNGVPYGKLAQEAATKNGFYGDTAYDYFNGVMHETYPNYTQTQIDQIYTNIAHDLAVADAELRLIDINAPGGDGVIGYEAIKGYHQSEFVANGAVYKAWTGAGLVESLGADSYMAGLDPTVEITGAEWRSFIEGALYNPTINGVPIRDFYADLWEYTDFELTDFGRILKLAYDNRSNLETILDTLDDLTPSEALGYMVDFLFYLSDRGWLPGGAIGDSDDAFDQGMQCPIVLDLDGDGIEYVSRANSDVFFDIDGDNFAEHVEWLDGDDGFLVRDINGNGQIDSVAEMFGEDGGTTAYQKLDALDTSSPSGNVLNSSDAAWSSLRVWQDANEDGKVDSGELKTLSSLNITSINTSHTNDTVSGGHAVAGTSTFVMNGNTRNAVGTLLETDQTNSWYIGDGTPGSTEIDLDTLFLPLSRGYGEIPSLHYAMTQDSDLKDMVTEFATLDIATGIDEIYDRIEEIVLRWTDADGVTPGSRGPYYDADRITALEAIHGRPYVSSVSNDPNFVSAGGLGKAFALFANEIMERLLVQGPLQVVFENATYSFAEDKLELNDTLANILSNATANQPTPGSEAHTIYWNEIGRIVDHYHDDLGVSQGDARAAVKDAAGFDVDPYTVIGTSGDDLIGSEGADDTLWGGAGNDTMVGSDGNDVYVFGDEGGADVIDHHQTVGSDYDAVRFTTLEPSDVVLTQSGDHLVITATSIGQTITVTDQFGVNYWDLQEIQFADGQIWNADVIYEMAVNSAAAPTPLVGTSGNDTLTATSTTLNMIGGAGADTFVIDITSSRFVNIADFNPDEGDMIDVRAFDVNVQTYGETDSVGNTFIELYYSGYTRINLFGWSPAEVDPLWFRSDVMVHARGQAIAGTGSADVITGTNAADTIWGNGGNDSIDGGRSANFVYGGDGNDTIGGWEHDDLFTGDAGNDLLDGGSGNDSLYGGTGADSLIGYNGNDFLGGDADNDSLSGGDSNDTIEGGAGADTLNGGNGTDRASYANSSAGVDVRLLNASQLYGDAAGDVLSGIENLEGSALNDTLVGDTGVNVILGGLGNDALNGRDGADILNGGDGFDMASYSLSTSAVTINLATNTHTGGEAAGDDLISIEYIYGSAYHDSITGSAVAELFNGAAGNDTLSGGDGNDMLFGAAGADSLIGGDGIDTATYANSSAAVDVRLLNASQLYGDAAGDVLAGIENLEGSSHADTLVGDSGVNVITGGLGNDALNGRDGADILNGGDGFDMASYSLSASAVNVNLATNTHTGGEAAGDDLISIEYIFGSNYNDTITGGAVAEQLTGHVGNDLLTGGGGNDTIVGGSGTDNVYAGNDNDLIYGDDDADTLRGEAGNDVVHSGNGDDVLSGNDGNDTLYGDAGNDSFVFHVNHGNDVVMDFTGAGSTPGDTIRLYQVPASGGGYVDDISDLSISYNAGASTATITTTGGTIVLHGITTALVNSDFVFG